MIRSVHTWSFQYQVLWWKVFTHLEPSTLVLRWKVDSLQRHFFQLVGSQLQLFLQCFRQGQFTPGASDTSALVLSFFSIQVTFRGTLPNISPQVQEQVQAHESTTKILGQFDKKTESQQERSGTVEMQRIKFRVSKLDISGYNLILLNLI